MSEEKAKADLRRVLVLEVRIDLGSADHLAVLSRVRGMLLDFSDEVIADLAPRWPEAKLASTMAQVQPSSE